LEGNDKHVEETIKMENSAKEITIGIVPKEDVNGPYSALTLNEKGIQAHDLAGDEKLLFVGQVVPVSCFRVFNRETKEDLGVFPAPSRGHIVPFKFRLGHYENLGADGCKGTVYLLDGVYPKIAGLHDALILKYNYEFTKEKGFKADLVKEYRSRPTPFRSRGAGGRGPERRDVYYGVRHCGRQDRDCRRLLRRCDVAFRS
jgi:hypothetical protein